MKNRTGIFSIFMILALVVGILGNGSQVQAAKIRLNMTKETLTVGNQVTLKVKGTRKKVKWSSSNKKVASVSFKGKVKAKKAGKATITAKVGKKKYKCRITVKKTTTTQKKTTEKNTEKSTEKTTEKTTEKSTEKTTEKTTEKSTEKMTEATTQATTEENTEATTEESTEATTQATTEESTEATTEETTQATTEESTEATTEETEQTTAPSEETKKYDAGEYSIIQTHNGEGTYYDRVTPGAANLDDYETSYYTAAMNHEDYMNGLAGAFIEITDKDGDKIPVLITDRLPEGAKGDIDLSRAAFAKIEPLGTGRMNIAWKIIPFPTTEPISYVFKPDSTKYWAEVQIRDGRYPIKKLEYYNATEGKYVELERQEYNYFTASSGMGDGPYTFRVTDFYGHVLTDTNISINTSSTPVKGKANFPY